MDQQQIVQKALDDAVQAMDVKFLCKFLFDDDLTPLQEMLIRKIAFNIELGIKRLSLSAMTRWGKSFCVSRGVAIYLMMHKNKTVPFIGPKKEQAAILRDYMTDLVMRCPKLLKMADLEAKGAARLQKEASRTRMTFTESGNEYRIFSAEGDADRLMGHGIGSGGGIIVKDEATLIKDTASAKISRMLGDSPDNAMVIELFNPWHRDNVAYKHTKDPTWEYIHIGWREAVEDGRVTKEFIDEQKRELTELMFTVLYESHFPKESEDQLIPYWAIEKAIRNPPLNLKVDEKILGCDIAEEGNDLTIFIYIERFGSLYVIKKIYRYPKQEIEETGRKIIKLCNELNLDRVSIDSIGVGAGVSSKVSAANREGLISIKLRKYKSSEAPIGKGKEEYKNLKAQAYFNLRKILIEENLIIPKDIARDNPTLIAELGKMKKELRGKQYIILDPGQKADDTSEKKSPDYADSLKMALWSKPKIISI